MLGRLQSDSLRHIPYLKFLGQTQVNKGGLVGGTPKHQHGLYKLIWDKPEKDEMPVLPPHIGGPIEDLTFALTPNYRNEIVHFTQLYAVDRNRERPFDTVIRDMCLEPSTSAINCAFRLLADCVCDEQSRTWTREMMFSDGAGEETPEAITIEKWVLWHLLSYRFWGVSGCGYGLVFNKSGFYALEEQMMDPRYGCTHQDDNIRLIKAIRSWEAQKDKARAGKQPEIEEEKLNPCYSTQEICGEKLTMIGNIIVGKLDKRPIPGTVIASVNNLRARFDAEGDIDIVTDVESFHDQDLKINTKASRFDYNANTLVIVIASGDTFGYVPEVAYSYEVKAGQEKPKRTRIWNSLTKTFDEYVEEDTAANKTMSPRKTSIRRRPPADKDFDDGY